MNQRGLALVTTLLVVALLAITVVEFTYSVQVDQHMARNALTSLQATVLARSGINLGEAVLLHDDEPTFDAYVEDWGRLDELNNQLVLPDTMRLRVQIVDEGGKLNLNAIRPMSFAEWRTYQSNPESALLLLRRKGVLEELLQFQGADPVAAEELLEYWGQLLTMYFSPADAASASQPGATPGRTPTPFVGSVAERMALLDFPSLDDAAVVPSLSPTAIRRLRAVLTALPYHQQPRVNVNTAPREVLQAIIGDESIVDGILSQREQVGLQQSDLSALLRGLSEPGAGGRAGLANMLGVTSSFFLIRASATVNVNPVTGRGGISRSASMLVRRDRRSAAGTARASAVHWTLTQLDWQKESGAVLFAPQEDQDRNANDLGPPGYMGFGG